ncbi:hypothetical protein GYB59_03275 [bacterium]|nr:hypothetical protein [bacterium]
MRRRATCLFMWLLLIVGGLPGCLVLQVGVSNPAPNLPQVAVAPFVNLSAERSVDGRRFAEAYFTELQKVPGFQVIPVGVVDSAMHDYNLNLNTPDDMQKLIEILDVDAVVFGAVTEYNPYYPPRLGLQISWYTTKIPNFEPGIPLDPHASKFQQQCDRAARKSNRWAEQMWHSVPGVPCNDKCNCEPESFAAAAPAIRGQSPEVGPELPPLTPAQQAEWEKALLGVLNLEEESPTPAAPVARKDVRDLKATEAELAQSFPAPAPSPQDQNVKPYQPPPQPRLDAPANLEEAPKPGQPQSNNDPSALAEQSLPGMTILPGEDPFRSSPFPQPYMSYTRVFDGADADFTAALKNYLELSGDQRSGGWTGYLLRSEDFIRFSMHRMILEMLQLHGGEAERRFVLTSRKYQ